MAFNEFYMNSLSGAIDLNAGSTTSDVGGGSDAAVYTSLAGDFDGTSIFTPNDGSTPASSVSAGMWGDFYNVGDTSARCIAQIASVAAGVNGAITLNPATKYGTVPTASAGAHTRSLKVGGAWATPAIMNGLGAFNLPASTRLNVKAANYAAITAALNINGVGAAGILYEWRGYKTTPGDRDTFLVADNAVWVLGTDVPYFNFTGAGRLSTLGRILMSNIGLTAAVSAAPAFTVTVGPAALRRCYIANTAANGTSYALSSSQGGSLFGSTLKANALAACLNLTAAWNVHGTYFRGGLNGIKSSVGQTIVGSMFDNQAADALNFSANSQLSIMGNTIYNPVGHGIVLPSAQAFAVSIVGNLFHTVATAGKFPLVIVSPTGDLSATLVSGNTYYAISGAFSSGFGDLQMFDNTLEATDPLSGAASHDFTYTGTTGQGAGGAPFFWNPDDTAHYLTNRDPGSSNRVYSGGSGGVTKHAGIGGGLVA